MELTWEWRRRDVANIESGGHNAAATEVKTVRKQYEKGILQWKFPLFTPKIQNFSEAVIGCMQNMPARHLCKTAQLFL